MVATLLYLEQAALCLKLSELSHEETDLCLAAGSAPTVAEVAAPEGGIQLQGGGGLFPLPGKKLKLLR